MSKANIDTAVGGNREIDGGELIAQGGYGCVYYPGIKCPGRKGNYEKYATKLEVDNSSLKNEIAISLIIRKIENYKKFFVPILKSCPIKLTSFKDMDVDIEKCEVVDKNIGAEFVLIYMQYIKGKDLFDIINDIFRAGYKLDQKRSNIVSRQLMYYYKYLLEGLTLLLTKDIVHMDLKRDNIRITSINKKLSRALIIDFGLSLNIRNIIELLKGEDSEFILYELRKSFIAYAPDVDYWPLEVHFISYILFKNEDNNAILLNRENIKYVIESIIGENKIYSKLSNEYKVLLRTQGTDFMNSFIGRSNLYVIRELISYYSTWDNFSLSIMYFRILNDINDIMDKQNVETDNVKKFKSISDILLLNISMDPRKRLSILDTKVQIFGENKKRSLFL